MLTFTWADLVGMGIDAGPMTADVSVLVDDGAGGTDLAATTLAVQNLVDLAGRVFDDRDNDGVFEPEDGDTGIEGVLIELFDQATVPETLLATASPMPMACTRSTRT